MCLYSNLFSSISHTAGQGYTLQHSLSGQPSESLITKIIYDKSCKFRYKANYHLKLSSAKGGIDMKVSGKFCTTVFCTFFVLGMALNSSAQSPIIIDHNCVDLYSVPVSWINQAKTDFRLWYGHTSHGSQITSGMFTLQSNIGDPYTYNNDGTGGALSYQETGGDLGHLWESGLGNLHPRPVEFTR